MTPMLEKIARAITNALEEVNPNAHSTFSEDEAEVCVRAALLAMREPDEAMIDAGEQEQGDCMGYERKAAVSTFTTMIDTILGEKPA